jgi:hypothetical protein
MKNKEEKIIKAWALVWNKEFGGLPDIAQYNIEDPFAIFSKKKYIDRWAVENLGIPWKKELKIKRVEIHFKR